MRPVNGLAYHAYSIVIQHHCSCTITHDELWEVIIHICSRWSTESTCAAGRQQDVFSSPVGEFQCYGGVINALVPVASASQMGNSRNSHTCLRVVRTIGDPISSPSTDSGRVASPSKPKQFTRSGSAQGQEITKILTPFGLPALHPMWTLCAHTRRVDDRCKTARRRLFYLKDETSSPVPE